MNKTGHNQAGSTMAQQIAEAVREYQTQSTGHAPKAVSVVLSEDTLVITLQEALSSAEQALSKTAEGAAQVREFHRQLFATSSKVLIETIARITGRAVREATAEVDPATGAIVHAFTTGTMVQVFQLAGGLSPETRDGTEHESSGDSS